MRIHLESTALALAAIAAGCSLGSHSAPRPEGAQTTAAVDDAAPVTWTGLVNTAACGATITKVGGEPWADDAGAISAESIASGDGVFQYTVDEVNRFRFVGFTHRSAWSHAGDIDFAFRMQAGHADAYENDEWRADILVAPGDVLRIDVANGVVTYSKNGAVQYTSARGPTYPLRVATSMIDAGSTITDARIAGSSAGAADAGTPDAAPPPGSSPVFGCWGNGTPDPDAVVRARFDWFESGYPGTLSASANQTLANGGVLPIAYINASEVPNDDAYLQKQIGSFWSSIALCQNTSWNTTVVDVRDPRWLDWLARRANAAYAIGNRGIKWDVAAVEQLCDSWGGDATKQKQAVDAVAGVLAQLKQVHPDFKFIVNGGFGLANAHPELVDGFESENLVNYADAHPGDSWSADQIAALDAVHARGVPIFELEYIDLFGCADPTCPRATQLIAESAARGWVPYVTNVAMSIEGRGAHVTPPW